jgi:hypothetical protein
MKYATKLSVGRFGTKSWRAKGLDLDDETRCEGPARITDLALVLKLERSLVRGEIWRRKTG